MQAIFVVVSSILQKVEGKEGKNPWMVHFKMDGAEGEDSDDANGENDDEEEESKSALQEASNP